MKYYNTKTCNVLTSRNFKQITPPQTDPIPEDVDITPDSWPEGESDGDVPPTGITGSDDITPTLEPGSMLSVGYGNSSQGNPTEIRAREQKEPGFNL